MRKKSIVIAIAAAAVLASSGAWAGHDVGAVSVRNGWAHTPDVTDYVLAKPHSDKLGYSSPCHIESLVFAQCFLEPRWSVKEAVNALI
jgi:hypothetical protein